MSATTSVATRKRATAFRHPPARPDPARGNCPHESEAGALREYLDELKAGVDLTQLVGQERIVAANGMALCPFHEERTPSFRVSRSHGLFHCFGCGVSGDAITYLQKRDELGFCSAVDALAEFAGFAKFQWGNDASQCLATRRRDEVRLAAVRFYESHLTKEHKARILDERGLLEETLLHFHVGYGAPGLQKHLEALGYSISECLDAGVLEQSSGGSVFDPMRGRLVFPNILNGRVVHISGRAIKLDPKWRHSKGSIEGLFNQAAATRANEIVVVEGPFDCLAVHQFDMPCVALYGTERTDALFELDLAKFEKVSIAMDGDDSGKKAGTVLGQRLPLKGRMVELAEGRDPCDLLADGMTADGFRELLENAKPWIEVEAERVKELPTADRGVGIRTLARAAAGADAVDGSLITEIVCGEKKLIPRKDFKCLVAEERSLLAGQKPENVEESAAPEMTEEERREAIELLEDEHFLDRVLDVLDAMGSVGEEANELVLYLAMTSRRLEQPISVRVKGESSGGKSYTVKSVTRLFPPEDILELTAMSDKALFHLKNSMEHKIFIIYERPGAANSDYQIRTFQSEGHLRYMVTLKDPKTGALEAREVEVKGPIAYIETTTEARVHPENETRAFNLHIDESRDQTARILERQRLKAAGELVDIDALVHRFRNAQRMLESLPVRIPFASLIEFPTTFVRARRDQVRFLALIEASAYLAQRRRGRSTVGGQEFIDATVGDYTIAHELASEVLKEVARGYSPKCELMLRKAWLVDRDSSDCSVDQLPLLEKRDIIKATGWSKTTTDKYLAEAEEVGFVDPSRGRGKPNTYRLLRLPSKADLSLLSPDELQARIEATRADPPKSPSGQVKDLKTRALNPPEQQATTGSGAILSSERNAAERIPLWRANSSCVGEPNSNLCGELTHPTEDWGRSGAGLPENLS